MQRKLSLRRVGRWLHPWLLGVCLVAANAVAGEDEGDQAARGRQLLARYHCGACHAIPGVPASRGSFAVSLEAFGRRSYIAGRVATDPANLAQWIARPQSIVPDTLMPDMGVSPRDAADMAAYLLQLR
jgi:cytochrome c